VQRPHRRIGVLGLLGAIAVLAIGETWSRMGPGPITGIHLVFAALILVAAGGLAVALLTTDASEAGSRR
jgi:hypothetical protein